MQLTFVAAPQTTCDSLYCGLCALAGKGLAMGSPPERDIFVPHADIGRGLWDAHPRQ